MLSQSKIKRHLRKFPTSYFKVIVLSGPTASGKKWIAERLSDTHRLIVSTTSRPPRVDEQIDISYQFISKPDYEKLLLRGKFATTFTFEGHYYGYLVSELKRAYTKEYTPLAIVYYKALESFLEKFPNSQIYFIYPPFTKAGLEALKRRMLSTTVWNFEKRWDDTLKQMEEMYVKKPNLLDNYPGSRLIKIRNQKASWDLINLIQKN